MNKRHVNVKSMPTTAMVLLCLALLNIAFLLFAASALNPFAVLFGLAASGLAAGVFGGVIFAWVRS